jgi:type IV pilus assembly protein PilA
MANYPSPAGPPPGYPPPGYPPQGAHNFGVAPAGGPKKGLPVWLIVLIAGAGFFLLFGGVMATLAIYGVRKYISNAKTAEAVNSLRQIDVDAVAAFDKGEPDRRGTITKHMCRSASAPVPATMALIKGAKYQSSAADWNADQATNSGFYCLKFSMESPQYFRYRYVVTGGSNPGDTFVAEADGDLAGDGNITSLRTTGEISPANALTITQTATMK